MAAIKDLSIVQGDTFKYPLRWGGDPVVYKPITGTIQKTAPVHIPCTAHGIPDGWRAAVVSAKGMTQINASNPPKDKEFHVAKVIDANTVEFNDVNAAEFSSHTAATGYLTFYTPVDLAGYTARMQIKDKIGGLVLLELTTVNNRIVLDNAAKRIDLTISEADTASIEWKSGVYDLEMISPAGVVTKLVSGKVTVVKEVTTL